MIRIGLNNSYSVDINNKPYINKELTATLSDFSFLNNKSEIGKLEEVFSNQVEKNSNKPEIEVNKNKRSFLDNISFYRMAERPFSPETNEVLGEDIVYVGCGTGEPVISVLNKVTLVGNSAAEFGRIELTKEGFEKHGVETPISKEKMIELSENIVSWLKNGGSPGKEITEEDLYNIAIDGKLDDLASLSTENLALKSITEQSTKSYEAMSKMIEEIIENDKKVDCAG